MVLRAAHGEVDPLLVLDPGIDPVLDPFAADPARSVAADALFESFVLAVAEPLDRVRLEGALQEPVAQRVAANAMPARSTLESNYGDY